MRENNWEEGKWNQFFQKNSNEIFRQNIVFPPLIPFSKSPVSYYVAPYALYRGPEVYYFVQKY